MIDLHCHVLPGIDDGPSTLEESLEMARAAAAAGTRTIVATPHVSWEYRNRAETIATLVGELNARLGAEGVALEIRSGAELAMTRIGDLAAGELSRLTLGGGRWLLVEPPFTVVATGLDLLVADLQRQGYRVLLAHPERCPAFQRDRKMLEGLIDAGALGSLTAGSLGGTFGEPVRRFSLELLADGLIHNVASDAHDPIRRSPSIAAEIEQAGLGALREWLTESVPAAILAGGEIPARPHVEVAAPGGRLRRLLGGR